VTGHGLRLAHAELRAAAFSPDRAWAVEVRDQITAIYPHGMPADVAAVYAQLTATIQRSKES
jgi:hypothetical protein